MGTIPKIRAHEPTAKYEVPLQETYIGTVLSMLRDLPRSRICLQHDVDKRRDEETLLGLLGVCCYLVITSISSASAILE